MLMIISAAAAAAWLLAFVAAMAAPRAPRQPVADAAAPRPVDLRLAGGEPPALVSLLAGNLDGYGYAVTLLDLAARGWLGLEDRAGGPVMCVITGNPPHDELTAYERRVYQQVVVRAGGRSDVPAQALSDGFAGQGSKDGLKPARDSFMAAFAADVKQDSRRRGLSRQRLSEAAGCLLFVAAAVPAATLGLALAARHSHGVWIAVAGFFVLCAVAGVVGKGERLTPAGRAVLERWRHATLRGGAIAMGPVLSPGWPDRQVAYAAALGRARPAVQLFAGTRGQPPGKKMWSSYGGTWREVTIGERRGCVGGLGLLAVALLWALVPATFAGFVVSSGALKEGLLLVLGVDTVLAVAAFGRWQSKPSFAEFDGLVLEAWIEIDSSENGGDIPHIAIDDGVSDRAWVFGVTRAQYGTCIPGTVVHARVNPRWGRLLDARPAQADRLDRPPAAR
jgi:hypothetical protein